MDTTTAYELLKRIPNRAAAGSIAEDALRRLVRRVTEYARCDETLLRAASSVENSVGRVRRAVAENFNVNSLGELQSAADDFDRACAARQAAAERVMETASEIVAYGLVTHDDTAAILEGTPFARES